MRKNLYPVIEDFYEVKYDDLFKTGIIKKCFDIVNSLVVAIDQNGTIILINEKGCELLEYEENEILGKNWILDFADNVDFLDSKLRVSNYLNSNILHERVIHILRTRSSKRIIVEARHVIFKNEKDKFAGILISGDITDSSMKEGDGRKNSKTAIDNTEEATKAKNLFLANISHEIRTPLNALVGFSEQLFKTNLNNKQKEYVKIIDRASGYLLKLVNEILEFSRIEAGEVPFEESPFKPSDVLNEIFTFFKLNAEEKSIQFNLSMGKKAETVVLGDSSRLKQILINIVDNAIKFTDSGCVQVCCSAFDESDNSIFFKFEVIDSGIGIPADKIDLIFDQFKNTDPSISKRFGGTGLGLTISKRLIELLNGKLIVKSKLGSGSVFSFTIPFKKSGNIENLSFEYEKVNEDIFNRIKILLVDDDRVNRLLGKTILNNFHCKIDIAVNGKDAIRKLSKNKYDVVLLDIHMPEVSGLDVARFIRKDLKNDFIKIIAVTAAIIKKDILLYQEAGIDDYLMKPFKEKNLFDKILKNIAFNFIKFSDTETKIPDMENMLLYNLDELKKIAKDDSSFIKKMLLTFITNSTTDINKIKKSVKEQNWKQVGETAHKMLPSFRHLEIKNVIPDLVNIKVKCLIDPDYERVPQLVNHLAEETNKVINLLKKEASVLQD